MINFSEKYDRKKFGIFLKEFLPEDLLEKNKVFQVDEGNEYFKKAILLGSIESLENLVVFEIERKRSEKSRIAITKELFKFLSTHGYSKALIVTFSEKESHYRFSLIKSDLKWAGTKVNRDFSNPKRLSFRLGAGSKVHTASKQLIKLGKLKSFDDLYQRFNIEIVNNEFFENYKNLYLTIEGKLKKDKEFSSFAKKIKLETSLFAKKLLGQIVFCYFLQKKGWLGVKKDQNFGYGDQKYLKNQFTEYSSNKKNFFNDFLEYFFYEGLNKKNENNYVKSIKSKVPYIGGGLFEYHEEYDWKNENLKIPNNVFSNTELNGILDIFDLYNFTVDENADFDIEISIDPEMLGNVFENLLPENLRKERGTFYTPKYVVENICKETLFDFLNYETKFFLKEDVLKSFIFDKEFETPSIPNLKKYAQELDNLLLKVKICDPAVGSGAFAVKIMNLIVELRIKLNNLTGRVYKKSSYYFKRDCIQNSIYGVDIDDYAVEITKLRLWLSLIEDKIDYIDIEPLPNLDFKIVQGNSLLEEYNGINIGSSIFVKKNKNLDLFSNNDLIEKLIKNLAILQNTYFKTISYSKKRLLKKEIELLMMNILSNVLNEEKLSNLDLKKNNEDLKNIFSSRFKRNCFPWGIFFADVFYNNKGFDIIIGNPPYVDSEEMVRSDKKLRDKYTNIYQSAEGNWDLFVIFCELGFNLLKENGVISFIVKNTLVASTYTKKLREKFLKLNVKEIIDYSTVDVFKEADVYPMIFRAQNSIEQDDHVKMTVMDKIDKIHNQNLIEKKFFYKNIIWDYYFSDPSIFKIIKKLLLNNTYGDPYVSKILSACTVDEAYKIKKILEEDSEDKKNFYKLTNSGTLEPFFSTWGVDSTQYIKDQYKYPVVNIKKLEKISELRSNITISKKLIIANMTRGIECFYDHKAKFLAGKSTTVILPGKGKYSLEIMAAFLNSDITNFFVLIYFNSLKMQGGAINFGPKQIGQIPIPKKIKFEEKISKLVKDIVTIKSKNIRSEIDKKMIEINNLIFKNFNLNQNEIVIIKNYLNKINNT